MTTSERDTAIELTTNNRLPGVVTRVTIGSVMAEVVAAVTRHGVERLALDEGGRRHGVAAAGGCDLSQTGIELKAE